MKKSLLIVLPLLTGLTLLCGCNNENTSTPTWEEVHKMIQGTWRAAQLVEADGETVTDDPVVVLWTFDNKNIHGGKFSLKEGDKMVVINGEWVVEPYSDTSSPCFIYFQRGGGEMIGADIHDIYDVTQISSTSMKWRLQGKKSGYNFTRVE